MSSKLAINLLLFIVKKKKKKKSLWKKVSYFSKYERSQHNQHSHVGALWKYGEIFQLNHPCASQMRLFYSTIQKVFISTWIDTNPIVPFRCFHSQDACSFNSLINNVNLLLNICSSVSRHCFKATSRAFWLSHRRFQYL